MFDESLLAEVTQKIASAQVILWAFLKQEWNLILYYAVEKMQKANTITGESLR